MITGIQLKQIINNRAVYSDIQLNAFAGYLNQVFVKYNINTRLRVCHFLAQILKESGCFRYTKEIWVPTAQQLTYEGRLNLGNTQPGDGFRFRGRSWIEDTGRYVYEQLSREFGQDFVNNPDLLSQQPWCALAAGSFWNKKGLNAIADTDNLIAVTKKVNGGLTGYSDRLALLTRCKLIITN